MTRKQKLILNTSSSLLNQVITVICGIILPRAYISAFGSDVNGLVASITQFVSIISFLQLGVGSVVQSSLYGPLAKNDKQGISAIVVSSNRFFRKIAIALIFYAFVLLFAYPNIINTSYPFLFTGSLILIITISSFAQYFFGITYQLLLNSDQLAYITLLTNAGTTILNTILVLILIQFDASIQLVKFLSTVVFLIRPMVYQLVVRQRYSLDLDMKLTTEPIAQKWNGIAQHIASVVLTSTDIIVLTLFSSLSIVSVYSVYYYVVHGIRQIVVATTAGVKSLFGNMLYNNEIPKLNQVFEKYEWMMHTFTVLIFTITGVLLVPFIKVYTVGISDYNYIYPAFGVLLTLAQGVYCLRLPYNQIVLAAGHFKQTQSSAIIEASLNICISVGLVISYGLIGVAIGTLVAMTYRTIYLAWYLSHNILKRKFRYFVFHSCVDIVSVFVMVFLCQWIELVQNTFFAWFVMAIKVSLLCLGGALISNLIFYPQLVFSMQQGIRR
ncbi:MAG: lipopolysaccharide biosynthesis protein [Sphaerochaetaceae bacterium]